MPKPCAQDVRKGVVRAVEAESFSHEAAAAFEVSPQRAEGLREGGKPDRRRLGRWAPLDFSQATAVGADGVRTDGVAMPSFIHRAASVFRGRPAIGYLMAFASIGIATALQWLARDGYQGAPFLTIYPAVILTAFVGGYRAGFFSAILAGLSQWYFFISEFHWLGVLSYIVDAVVCVLLIEYINRCLERETQAKQHQALLKDELHHRIHNLFAVVQAVIRFSLPSNDVPVSPASIKDRLFDRLQAMHEAAQYISDSKGEVALFDFIRGQIRGVDKQCTVCGQPLLMLNPQLTQNLSLILHELVTNSLKYGALSTSNGRVHIDLKEVPTGVVFDWAEANGPLVSAPPDDRSGDGFGSRILGPFARSFCSNVNIAFDPTGFRYSLQLPRQEGVLGAALTRAPEILEAGRA